VLVLLVLLVLLYVANTPTCVVGIPRACSGVAIPLVQSALVARGLFMPFERFTDVGRVFRPRASLRSNGQLGFNHGCVKRFDMEKFSHVVLFYDADTNRIGVQLIQDKNEPGASTLITKGGNGTVSARSFFEYYKIKPKKTTQYDIERDDATGMLIIEVGKPAEKS
jgi:hypothetical protein